MTLTFHWSFLYCVTKHVDLSNIKLPNLRQNFIIMKYGYISWLLVNFVYKNLIIDLRLITNSIMSYSTVTR